MLKIIISPAKKMNIIEDYPCGLTTPLFLDRAHSLHEKLKGMSLAELKNLWSCSDRLAAQNYAAPYILPQARPKPRSSLLRGNPVPTYRPVGLHRRTVGIRQLPS